MIVGIDPGRRGGIAVYEDGTVNAAKMPEDVLDLGKMLAGKNVLVFIEKVGIRPDDMSFGKASRVQKMLSDYERLKAGLEQNGVPYVMVHPMKWQSYLGVRVNGMEKADRKRHYKKIAERMYPNTVVTLLNADALLIMTFGLRVLRNDRGWIRANCPVVVNLEKLF